MDQKWFEMPDIRRRKFANVVWIPLRASQRIEEEGRIGYLGYKSDFFQIGTLAVPAKFRAEAEKLRWGDINLMNQHAGWVDGDRYIPADSYEGYGERISGLHLVLDQYINSTEKSEWHLHQDFVVTLELKREGDTWVRPNEDYLEIARLFRDDDGSPCLLEVRASHLKDYLCARGMLLHMTHYRRRGEVSEDCCHIMWPDKRVEQIEGKDRWMGSIVEIHEGGEPFGGKTAVFHAGRTDVDPEEDVPVFNGAADDQVSSKSWVVEHTGKKLYYVRGELWRTELIAPSSASPIVRGDKTPPTVFFITDAEGKKESRETLANGSRWLWFRPEVICALAHRKGGWLRWYTRDTGSVSCSPDGGVHFGVNSIGLINVFAADIALLPEWQQKIWSGYNVSPEGKVSGELLDSQMRCKPAATQAPEAFLAKALVLTCFN